MAQSMGRARMLEQSGQLDAALVEYRTVLARQPADLSAYAGLRRLAAQMERFELLDSVSARLAGLYPERPEYGLGRVEALLGRNRAREAVRVARDLLTRRADHAMSVVELFERGGELRLAAEFLTEHRAALGAPATARLMELYERQQRHPEAAREFVTLAGIDPRLSAGLMPRLREYGGHPGWRGVLTEVRRLPDGPVRARAEAEVLLGAGREAEAAHAARQGLDRDELYGFAHEAEAAGAFTAALALYEELGLASEQARVLRELGRVDDAAQLLRQDSSPKAQFELAQLERLVRRDYEAAARSYAEILRRDPGNADAAWGLATSRVALGDTAGAREALARIVQPSDSVLYFRTRLAFYAGAVDSLRRHANQLLVRFPASRHLNDALELVLLAGSGEDMGPLVRAMLPLEAGRTDSALAEARILGAGRGTVAENALLLSARILAEAGRTDEAFGVLDSFPVRFPASPRRARALFEQAELAGALGDDDRRLRLIEQVLLEHPASSYAIVGRTVRAELLRTGSPTGIR
ncbi:MAG TPA: tetratricopeptide repeat protein [candidate division WOR-3 bacterium]|uniref:Tetratricopeptide repeat protein n=1 Tax=candidate division WOR-3 bacterium TaxID=2052148 RepID=A0A7V0T496_UNCW3|nr:tetratricopeptide repeat protein [candidate division WOR-3 bacterium]